MLWGNIFYLIKLYCWKNRKSLRDIHPFQVWRPPMETGRESWSFLAWRREGFGETLQSPSSICREPTGKMGRYAVWGSVVMGQRVMALNQRRDNLDYILGGNSLLRGRWGAGTAAQRSCGCPIPGGAQGQVGWDPGQPDLVFRTGWALRSPPA